MTVRRWIDAGVAVVGDAFNWWLAELAALAPLATSPARATTLAVSADGRLPAVPASARSPVNVLVPSDWVLLRQLRLPEAVRENLSAAIAAEMDRVTPFTPDAVHSVYRLAAREAGEIVVDLAVLPRRLVTPLASQLAKAGMTIGRLSLAEPAPAWLLGKSFLPRVRRRTAFRLSRPVLALLVLSLLAPSAALQWRTARLARDAGLAHAEADETLRLARELASRRSGLAPLEIERAAHPSMSRLLADLTASLPQTAYLDSLTVVGDHVSMTGYAASAAALIPALSAGDRLTDVRFAGAVTRDADRGLEHFLIAATYAGHAP
jgi:general secretion pathway protein L